MLDGRIENSARIGWRSAVHPVLDSVLGFPKLAVVGYDGSYSPTSVSARTDGSYDDRGSKGHQRMTELPRQMLL